MRSLLLLRSFSVAFILQRKYMTINLLFSSYSSSFSSFCLRCLAASNHPGRYSNLLIDGICRWNFTFPTKAEQTAWRVFSMIAFAMCWPIFILCELPLFIQWRTHGGISSTTVDYDIQQHFPLFCCLMILFIVYSYARLGNLVLMFISLRALPAGSYISIDWLAAIPHI
jgi:hypothetical protein